MITENLSTLKIHKLTQEQYDREFVADNLNENEIYLTPDRSISVWQPNTKYRIGDLALVNFKNRDIIDPVGTFPIKTIIVKCLSSHTSSDYFEIAPPLSDDCWEIVEETYAYNDALGRRIHNTYATKEELGNIETALDELHSYAQALISESAE